MVLDPSIRDRVMEAAGLLIKKAFSTGAAASDVLFSSSEGHTLELRNGQPEENTTGSSIGIGLRTIDGKGRQGIAYVNSLERGDLDDLLDWSWANCRLSEPDPDVALYSGPFVPSAAVEIADSRIGGIDSEYRLSMCTEMTEIANATDSRVESVRSASWSDGYGQVLYMSSAGFSGWYEESSVSCGVSVVLKGTTGMEMGGYGSDSEAVRRTAAVLDGSPVRTGRYDIILDPEVTASLLEVLGDLFLASNVHKDKSLLKGQLGKKVASDLLTITDDGTIPWGIASSPFDGEGHPTKKTVLLENGVVRSFLYNLEYAKHDGVSSTGNAARGISTLPDIDVSNISVRPGCSGPKEIISSTGKAIYVLELLGLHTVDPVSGDFSVGIKGFLVDSGRYAVPIAGMTIAGNIVEILDRIDKVGEDLKFFGNIGGCTLVVKDVAAAGI